MNYIKTNKTMKTKKDLFCKTWKYWRAKAGANAKHKNYKLLKLCNEQRDRYGKKYFEILNINYNQNY